MLTQQEYQGQGKWSRSCTYINKSVTYAQYILILTIVSDLNTSNHAGEIRTSCF